MAAWLRRKVPSTWEDSGPDWTVWGKSPCVPFARHCPLSDVLGWRVRKQTQQLLKILGTRGLLSLHYQCTIVLGLQEKSKTYFEYLLCGRSLSYSEFSSDPCLDICSFQKVSSASNTPYQSAKAVLMLT